MASFRWDVECGHTTSNRGDAVGRVAAATDGQGRFHGIWMERREAGAVWWGNAGARRGIPCCPTPLN